MDIKAGTHHLDEIPMPGRSTDLDVAARAAVRAGGTVMDIYRRDFEESKKEDGSPITEADLASHRILAEELAVTGHAVLSEEGRAATDSPRPNTTWIVDPLDGTSHFVNRTGQFTVMAALIEERTPVLGVIYWPLENTLFVAQKGRGAFRYSAGGWKKISVTDTAILSECRVVGSKHHLTDREKKFIARLGAASFVSIGSSLKVGMISAGEAEAYITTTDKMKEWDTAASHCIIAEAGGQMTDMRGRRLTYNNDDVRHLYGILATNGAVHGQIIDEFARMSGQQAPPAEK